MELPILGSPQLSVQCPRSVHAASRAECTLQCAKQCLGCCWGRKQICCPNKIPPFRLEFPTAARRRRCPGTSLGPSRALHCSAALQSAFPFRVCPLPSPVPSAPQNPDSFPVAEGCSGKLARKATSPELSPETPFLLSGYFSFPAFDLLAPQLARGCVFPT